MGGPSTIKISEGIYWIGVNDQEGGLHCNPYLLIDNDEAVLFDPGSILDFEYVYENICSLISLDKIKYVVLHHQDPDFCSSVPLFEKKGAKFKVVTHWRTQTLIKYYGITSEYYIVNENDFKLVLGSGRSLIFIQTPYLHFPGAITTYDPLSKILFSSDLFGAYSYEWGLYAKEDYLEKMKTFHEHYMPSNDILRPVMETFLGVDIGMIAPQHGSIINENVRDYIKALRDLECGAYITPIKKSLIMSGGYQGLFTTIFRRYAATFKKEELLEVLEGLEIGINVNTLIVEDYNYTGIELWNLIFERILQQKGIEWLIVIEPLVVKLSREYDLPIPEVFTTNLKKAEEKIISVNDELERLKEMNLRLNNSIKETEERLIRCPITGLYNYDFFKNYLKNELEDISLKSNSLKPALIIISIDNLAKIRYDYGDVEVDEVLRNTVYELNDLKGEGYLIFRLQGAFFVIYSPFIEKKEAVNLAENIRNRISTSELFVEKITVSAGVAHYEEFENEEKLLANVDETLYNIAMMRVRLAKNMGMNIVCSNSEINTYQETVGNILLVDNDEVNLDILKTFLENLNYKVYTATDGIEALKICEKDNINLIVSETMLPKLDGFLLREKLLTQSSTKNIPFILLSNLKDDNSVLRAAKLKIEHYYKKPYMLSELLGVIRNKVKGDSYK